MLTEYVSPHPIFAGAVAWPDGRTTIVVKLTFTVGNMGALEPTPAQDPLTLDVTDGRGEIVYPSDFAPYKPACDVSIVGDAVADRSDPGRLSLDSLVRTVEPRETLGPRQTFCPQGDPTDAAAFELWTTGGIDFARFQIAPPDRRLPWPGQGFTLGYARGSTTIHARFNGPTVRASVLGQDGSRIVARLPLPLDTVLFDPIQRKAWLLFRGVYASAGGAPAGRCAVELSTTPLHDVRAMASWRPSPLDTPAAARAAARQPGAVRGPPVVADETRVLSGPVALAALPFSSAAPALPSPPHGVAHDPTMFARPVDHSDVTSPAIRVRAETLPFQRTGDPARKATSPLSPQALGELRSRGAERVPSAWEAGSETRVARPRVVEPAAPDRPEAVAPPAYVHVPLQPTPRPIAPPVAPPASLFVLGASSRPEGPTPESRAPAGTDARPAAEVGAKPMTDEWFQEILQAIWKSDKSLAETLARYGLTDEEWREHKRSRKKR